MIQMSKAAKKHTMASAIFLAVVGLIYLALVAAAESGNERRALEEARTTNLLKEAGCKRTGFVGKNAEGVYMCTGGNMYKYGELHRAANPRR